MTREELAKAIAEGIIAVGVEGDFDSVSCSTAGDYPSIGVSQWEGDRAEDLLSRIPGGDYYSGRSYSDIYYSGEMEGLKELLNSPDGQSAQREKLSEDCLDYVDELWEIPNLDDTRCTIYAGMWCPTSTSVVCRFLSNRQWNYDLRDLDVLRALFKYQYAHAAGCDEYAEGYSNRANATYDYCKELDV